MRLIIHSVRLLCPASGLDRTGAIVADNGVVAAILPEGQALPDDGERLDGQGLCLVPGLVDARTEHTVSPALYAAAGITTVISRDNGLVSPASLHGKGEEMGDYGLGRLRGARLVSDGLSGNAASAAFHWQAMRYAAAHGLVFHACPLDSTFAGTGMAAAGELATRLGLGGVPVVAETLAIAHWLHLAESTGCPLHLGAITTRAGVAMIAEAKAGGIRVTADTSVPYMALNELAIQHHDPAARVWPPLRSEDDRQAVWQGLRDGTLDVLCSGHVPLGRADKNVPFGSAACGMDTLSFFLPQLLTLYHQGGLSLTETLAIATSKPAAILGLDAGRLEPGSPADFILFHPARTMRATFASPLAQSRAEGELAATIRHGRVVWQKDS